MNKIITFSCFILIFSSCKEKVVTRYETISKLEEVTPIKTRQLSNEELVQDISATNYCTEVSALCQSQLEELQQKIELLKERLGNSHTTVLEFKDLEEYISFEYRRITKELNEGIDSREKHFAFKALLEFEQCDLFALDCQFDETNEGRALHAIYYIDQILNSHNLTRSLDQSIYHDGKSISIEDFKALKKSILNIYKDKGKQEIIEIEKNLAKILNPKLERIRLAFYEKPSTRKILSDRKDEIAMYRERVKIIKTMTPEYMEELRKISDGLELEIESIVLNRNIVFKKSRGQIFINPVIGAEHILEFSKKHKTVNMTLTRDFDLHALSYFYGPFQNGGYFFQVSYLDMMEKFNNYSWWKFNKELKLHFPETPLNIHVQFGTYYSSIEIGEKGIYLGFENDASPELYTDKISEFVEFQKYLIDFEKYVETTVQNEVQESIEGVVIDFPQSIRMPLNPYEEVKDHDYIPFFEELRNTPGLFSELIIKTINKSNQKIKKVMFRDYDETDRTARVQDGILYIPLYNMNIQNYRDLYVVDIQ